MKPAPFDYVVPHSLEEALAIMAEHGYDAKLLAGGQSLVPMMNFRLAQPALLVDLNRVTELDTIDRDGSDLLLGSMVRQHRLAHDALLAAQAPLIHQAMPYVAHPQIRNRGTLGGSLAHADPAAELPVAAVALEARLRLRHSDGERWVKAEDFFTGIFTTTMTAEEILVEVAVPPMPPRSGYAFLEVARRHGDYALAGVAALLSLDENGVCTGARLVYLSLGEVPMVAQKAADLLSGEKVSTEVIEAAAETAAQQEVDPTDDIHATAVYKRHLAHVLTVRALQQAWAMAQSEA